MTEEIVDLNDPKAQLFINLQLGFNDLINAEMSRGDVSAADLVTSILPQFFAAVLCTTIHQQSKADVSDEDKAMAIITVMTRALEHGMRLIETKPSELQ